MSINYFVYYTYISLITVLAGKMLMYCWNQLINVQMYYQKVNLALASVPILLYMFEWK